MTGNDWNQSNGISHPGRVVEVFASGVDVAITAQAPCGSCRMKKACGMDESEEKTVTVFTPDAQLFTVGQEVEVLMKLSMGYKAIGIVYALPIVVVLGALVAGSRAGMAEIATGLASIGFLAAYYLIVYLLRGKINREIRFEIRIPRKNNQL